MSTSSRRTERLYTKYRELQGSTSEQLMAEYTCTDGVDTVLAASHSSVDNSDSLGMGIVRKDVELNADERRYLMAVERGDVPTVQQCLRQAKMSYNININCVDTLGRTALLIAIENDNIELIQLLLQNNVELRDALLHAINEDNVEATQLILRHQQTHFVDDVTPMSNAVNKEKAEKITARWKKLTLKRDASVDSEETRTALTSSDIGQQQATTHTSEALTSSSFTPDITPLILAAHRDNYEIIKILLDRGDRIVKPHEIRCSCSYCSEKSSEDSLNHSRSRVNAYRALASPSLMALSSKDPVLTAFRLSWELRRLSRLENELKVEYEQLAKQCQDFAVDLLDQVRGSKELEVLLNYDCDATANDNGDTMNLSRLKLAIKYKQKRFVSHANCQQLLASLWYEGLFNFRRRHIVFKVLLTAAVCTLSPVLSVIYIIAPKSVLGRFIRRPFIKFICHSTSYMTFLFLLILASQRIESIVNLGAGGEDTAKKITREVRGAPPTSIEWMILAYVAGLVWAEVKQLWDQGMKSYIYDMWNILDFITNSLYIATFTLKLVAYLRVEEEKRLGKTYLAQAKRELWDAHDPTLISEGLFAAANIFSSLKLIYIFTSNPHLGPLQISLGRMIMDIIKFLFIALLVCFSYSCGVNQLYWYYAEARSRECDECLADNETTDVKIECKTQCDRTLANLFEILQTLYFAIYGLVDIHHFELKEKHGFTQFVGKTMYGTYLGIMTIVLINMLIAMLSSSFQIISNDADTEWKFARSRLWMSYFEEGGTVPAPFNIVPTPKTVWYILRWFRDRLCRCSKRAKNNKWQSIRRAVKKKKERDDMYQAVIHDLIKRYVMKRQRISNAVGVSEDDINEIKQDISSFRYELLEILRSNGMATATIATPALPQTQSNARTRRRANRMSFKFSSSVDSDIARTHPATSTPVDCVMLETASIASLHHCIQQQQQQHYMSADTATECRLSNSGVDHTFDSVSLLPMPPSLQTLDEEDLVSTNQAFCSASKPVPETTSSVTDGCTSRSRSGSSCTMMTTSRHNSPSAERPSSPSRHGTSGRCGGLASPSNSSSSSKMAPTLRKILSRFRVEQVYDDFGQLYNNTPTSSSMSPLICAGAMESATVQGVVDDDHRLPVAKQSAGIPDSASASDDTGEFVSRATSMVSKCDEHEAVTISEDAFKTSTAGLARLLAKKVSFQISEDDENPPSAYPGNEDGGPGLTDGQKCHQAPHQPGGGDPWIAVVTDDSTGNTSDLTMKADSDDSGNGIDKRKRSKAWFRRKGGKKEVESPLKTDVV